MNFLLVYDKIEVRGGFMKKELINEVIEKNINDYVNKIVELEDKLKTIKDFKINKDILLKILNLSDCVKLEKEEIDYIIKFGNYLLTLESIDYTYLSLKERKQESIDKYNIIYKTKETLLDFHSIDVSENTKCFIGRIKDDVTKYTKKAYTEIEGYHFSVDLLRNKNVLKIEKGDFSCFLNVNDLGSKYYLLIKEKEQLIKRLINYNNDDILFLNEVKMKDFLSKDRTQLEKMPVFYYSKDNDWLEVLNLNIENESTLLLLNESKIMYSKKDEERISNLQRVILRLSYDYYKDTVRSEKEKLRVKARNEKIAELFFNVGIESTRVTSDTISINATEEELNEKIKEIEEIILLNIKN